ncbi:hypothetical protein VQ044_22355, partial [Aurantimonas sp. C2-5-R2]|uniref:hypothetical protein n=1 Tax=Aurantimonas sp. C2-5-R2 TaxID=3113713 RepID=UPI002F95007C
PGRSSPASECSRGASQDIGSIAELLNQALSSCSENPGSLQNRRDGRWLSATATDAGKGRAMVLDISIGGAAILIIGAGASDPRAASRCGAEWTRPARGGRPDSTIAS